MSIKTIVGLKRYGASGLLEERHFPSRSWVQHFFDVEYLNFSNVQLVNIRDITNTLQTLDLPAPVSNHPNGIIAGPPGGAYVLIGSTTTGGVPTYNTTSPLLGENMGVVVGSGNAAVTPTDYALQTKILHGVAAGTLLHGSTECFSLTFADPNGQFTIRRYFTNASGGNVTIEEVGIYAYGFLTLNTGALFCIARDVLGAAIVLNDTELLEVTYTPQITV